MSTPSALAQTTGTATVRVGCTVPGPPESLKARPVSPITYVADEDGVVVIEMESHGPTGGWVEETIVSGWAGDGYFRWNGPNLFNTPGVDTLSFRFVVPDTDTYLIRIHSRHDDPDSSQENDCWARMDNGPWHKLFENSGASGVGVWTYTARYEDTGKFPEHVLTAGIHKYDISGRSYNFKIDRVHALPKTIWAANFLDPQSELLRDRPIVGLKMRVEIDDPTNSAGLNPGIARTLWYGGFVNSNYPCGQLNKFGEALIALAPAPIVAGPPILWQGPGIPSTHNAIIPNDPSLIGLLLGTQGVLYQPGKLVLTDALDLFIGDQ